MHDTSYTELVKPNLVSVTYQFLAGKPCDVAETSTSWCICLCHSRPHWVGTVGHCYRCGQCSKQLVDRPYSAINTQDVLTIMYYICIFTLSHEDADAKDGRRIHQLHGEHEMHALVLRLLCSKTRLQCAIRGIRDKQTIFVLHTEQRVDPAVIASHSSQ